MNESRMAPAIGGARGRRRIGLTPSSFRAALLALLLSVASAPLASADEASPFANLDAAACAKLDDKNLQVGPPDAEIVEACAALRRSAVFGQSFSGGGGELALSLLGMVLVYAAFGVPMRAVAGLMRRSSGQTTAVLSIETLLGLLLRGAIGLLLVAILGLPYAMAIGCVGIILLLAAQFRRTRPASPPAALRNATEPPTVLSVILANLVNDAGASVVGLLGLVLLARRDPWLVGLGVALAIVASVPAVVAARRRLRDHRTYLLAMATVLGAIFGGVAIADPQLAQALPANLLPAIVIPALFAFAACGAVWTTLPGPARRADG